MASAQAGSWASAFWVTSIWGTSWYGCFGNLPAPGLTLAALFCEAPAVVRVPAHSVSGWTFLGRPPFAPFRAQ